MEVVQYVAKMCGETQHFDLCTEDKYDIQITQETLMKGTLSI